MMDELTVRGHRLMAASDIEQKNYWIVSDAKYVLRFTGKGHVTCFVKTYNGWNDCWRRFAGTSMGWEFWEYVDQHRRNLNLPCPQRGMR